MNQSSTQQGPRLQDPRTRRDFNPLHYPRVSGQDAPPLQATERNDHIKLAFLAVYYGLNCEYARLLECRARRASDQPASDEQEVLRAIEQLLVVRDQLEDQYAPLGVVAEPVVNDGFTVTLRISFGNVDAAGRRRSEMFTISTCVPVPLPESLQFEDLPITIQGPGIHPD
jgi:hypothetical protein